MESTFSTAWFLLGEGAKPSSFNWITIVTLWGPIIFIFYLLLIRPQRKEQETRQSMLEGIKKNDRVITIGGIYGVVANVNRQSDEVTVKVDEASNTKLRMTFESIARVLGDESKND